MKIVKLEIEDELFNDVGTFQIALVENPAHQTEFMYFKKQEFKSWDDYPQYMVDAARRAIKYLNDTGNPNGCLTPVGRKRASQLANRQPISLETIKRMWSYIQRHKVDLKTSKSYDDGCGLLAMDSWGSIQAENWIERILRQEDEFNDAMSFVDSAKGFSIGDFVSWTYAGRGDEDDRARGQIIDIRIQGEVNIPDTDLTLTATEEKPVLLIETSTGTIVGQYVDGDIRKIKKPENFNEYNLDVFGYNTNYFWVCPMAQKTFQHLIDMSPNEDERGMIRSAALQADAIFKIEAESIDRGYSTSDEVEEATLLVDDFYDLMGEIDKLLGMSHDVSYMDTHLETIKKLLDITQENLSCGCECRTEEMVNSVSVSIESLLDNGAEIIDDIEITKEMAENIIEELRKRAKKEGDKMFDKFYDIKSNPNAPSMLDAPNRRVRFVFTNGPGRPVLKDTSRKLCKQMMGQYQLVYRVEDIFILSQELDADEDSMKLVPRPKGTSVNQFVWKNGANCNHIWRQLTFTNDRRIANRVDRAEGDAELSQPASGLSGQLNPPAQKRTKQNMEYEIELPISYTNGLPIFRDLKSTEITSNNLGCNGKLKVVEYRGDTAYIPCLENETFKAIKQNQKFSINDEKRIITGPAVIPNKLIVRIADDDTEGMFPGEKYYVYFDVETTKRMAEKFLMEGRTKSANLEHNGKPFDDVYLVESWIIESEMDKAFALGFSTDELPIGTWMVSYKILNDDLWKNYVKKGKVLGWSVEGNYIMDVDNGYFEENSFQQKLITDDDIIMNKIINILKQVKNDYRTSS